NLDATADINAIALLMHSIGSSLCNTGIARLESNWGNSA
ncbi:hypothetical protein Tco_0125032, partial [Tanacetum coccineum]